MRDNERPPINARMVRNHFQWLAAPAVLVLSFRKALILSAVASLLTAAEPGVPDFSFAGYHSGRDPLPARGTASVNVRDFGARGDGQQDDSAAFLKAIAALDRGVILVPAGRYRITSILEIHKSGIVLRGEGPEKTTLYFPIPLNDIRPNWGATTTGDRTSNYSWSGGFVWIGGRATHRVLADVTADARRGDSRVAVSSASGLKPGQWVEVAEKDTPANTLADWIYSGDPGDVRQLRGRTRVSLASRITSVGDGAIDLERPLRFDLRAQWHPQILAFEPSASESAVEDLTFEFPPAEYRGHFTELGFNAVALDNTANCWVRHIRILNPDSGIFITGMFNTVDNAAFESQRQGNQGLVAHHGIYLSGSDNLFTHFDYRMQFIHDITVSESAGNVISAGKGIDLDFDHHVRAPFENLWTDIDAGAGTRLWESGGGNGLGRHCGSRETFWNIRAKRPPAAPPPGWAAPGIIFLPDATPPDLHLKQLSERLK
jgi:hypothetical protein